MLTGESGILTNSNQAKINDTHAKVYEAFLLHTQTYKIEKTTGVISVSLIEYLQEKEILSSNYQINVEKLVGEKLPLGNGTNGVNDIYKLEKITESAKLGSLEKLVIAESRTQSQKVRYKIVYYGQQVNNVTDITIVGDVAVDDKDVIEEYAEIFEYEDEAKTILKGIKKDFIKAYDKKEDGSKKEGAWNEIYKDGKHIKEITIPNGVTTIKDKAFFCYPYLTINLPSSVEKIGTQAFYDCDELYVKGKSSQAHFDEVGENAFVQTHVIYLEKPVINYDKLFIYKNGDKSIIEGINTEFIKDCHPGNEKDPYKMIINEYGEEIKEITIPNGVTTINDKVFFAYQDLTIKLPSSVEKIGAQAFYDCNTLYVEGKSSQAHFDEVGQNAFVFTTVIYLVPPEIYYDDIFIYKDANKSIIEGIKAEFIKEYNPGNKKASFKILVNEYGEEIKEITIPSSVTEISEKAFLDYENLTINLPKNVMILGNYTFYNCKKLKIYGKTKLEDFTSVGNNCCMHTVLDFIHNY